MAFGAMVCEADKIKEREEMSVSREWLMRDIYIIGCLS